MARGQLFLQLVDGTQMPVPCLDGAARADVAAAFPDAPHAASCGFMLMASAVAHVDQSAGARFVAELVDGESHEIVLSTLPLAAAAPALKTLGSRLALRLQDSGPLGVARWAAHKIRERVQDACEALLTGPVRRPRSPVVVVFDHAMGGGANAYRERLVARHLGEGAHVVVVTPRLATLDYELTLLASGTSVTWREQDEHALLATLDSMRVGSVELNNLVGFSDPLRLARWCVARGNAGAHVRFHLHDFHAVCPAFTLIDACGRYCGVPELDVCRACLPRNSANSLGLGQGIDPAAWRAAWGELLHVADEVVVFSEASARILRQAYPALVDAPTVRVRPHENALGSLRPVKTQRGDVLKVAVIGNISRPKGADIVADIARLARTRQLPLQIVVIGTLQASTPPGPHLVVHGAFVQSELPELMERYGIDVCLMPSVCPETYSFVTDEIMAMDLPLAVFDIGAPAERVAGYEKGSVIAEATAEAALAAIIRLAERTAVFAVTGQEQDTWERR